MKRRVRSGLPPKVEISETGEVITPTFKDCALMVYQGREAALSTGKHVKQWLTMLEDHAFDFIGDLSVDAVTTKHVIDLLAPIWVAKPETARRVLQRVATVIAWAAANEHRAHELAVKAVRIGLPPQIKKVEHHAAVSWQEAPKVYQAVKSSSDCMSNSCLRIIFLTLCRSNEARSARWDEVDFAKRVWTIPAIRTKMRREHKVPLSKEALAVLKELHEGRFSDLIFPNSKSKPLSDVAVSKALRRTGRPETVHGLRSTFRDWFGETTNLNQQIAKAVIGQAVGDRLEETYFRSTLFAKRVPIMEKWAEFLLSEK
jgi:integrase